MIFLKKTGAALAVAAVALAGCGLAEPEQTAARPVAQKQGGQWGQVQQQLDDLVAREEATAALVRVRTSAGTWAGSAGVADLESGRPARADGYFRIGSITKTFVAVVLLQLADEGKLRLDEPVARYLPNLVPSGPVTVRDVLQHTSLYRDYMSDPGYSTNRWRGDERFRGYRPEQLLKVAFSKPAGYPPETKWRYSNTNYVVAGLLIERLTGHRYGDEVRKRILRPLRLKQTSLPGNRPGLPRPHANEYAWLPGGRRVDATRMNPSLDWAAGEMISTTRDLDRFFDGLLGGRLLSARALAEMRRTVPANAEFRYGLGLQEYTLPCGVHVRGHSGQLIGYTTYALRSDDGRQLTLSVDLGKRTPPGERLYTLAGAVFC
ncbi:class A beta-lactamase-related serine hydrolase [Actinomadura darangshiensis]|uniref:Class A beta-lactamase-related serine hydrolase n=1 Tax=Actinomadura darangshiensis TaxID=705336 RepID=A0A4R5ARQ4_9ACTN|nr:serine hydrolase domain-containing protein [Actinomadura darangshiensis]TDD75393.1 class A beta-lactamase-related serine hydrolase [Actinomadura darangshiensis]